MLLHIFVVLLHDCQLEHGRCTVHADIDRVELPSWILKINGYLAPTFGPIFLPVIFGGELLRVNLSGAAACTLQ